MGFYTVWVRSLGYRGQTPLTYSSEVKLAPGAIVRVPMQRESVPGFVVAEVAKPTFATKPITEIYDLSPLPPQLLQLASWLQEFYTTTLGVIGTLLLPVDLGVKSREKSDDNVVSKALTASQPPLTSEQRDVVGKITKPDTYLLHGRTGSGKTRVYLELAQQAVKAGKSVLVLTPEIGLTSQLARSFRDVFGEQVVTLHSQLTPTQRRQVWLRILGSVDSRQQAVGSSRTDESTVYRLPSTPLVVIGARSALFCPLRSLGLIVIDEAHEPAYKQEQAPYYHARAVASKLARLHDATLIIGSATPAISDYYLASERQKPILRMKKLAQESDHPPTKINVVDLRDRGQFPRSNQLSQPLIEAVHAALARGEQSLIYLNRRGTARVVLCENCGWQALCPNCDLPLVYHADSGTFRCHTCGFHERLRTSCPECGHPSILFKSFGTKAVTDEVRKLFPNARVQRFDTDNLKAERLETHFEAVKRGDVDILVGTQLLAKGLDLPKLSVLGFVQADSSLAVPDFSAGERTYQLISQALGRVGRGHVAGQAIIQTFHPESPILQAAIADDYNTFYNTELAERKQFHFPPFYYLLKLSCRRATYASAETAALKLKVDIEANISVVEIAGPTPSFHEKLQGKYQVQLVVRSTRRADLLKVIKLLPPSGWSYDIDPIDLL